MENKFSVIKDNLKLADKAELLSDTITRGQLEELAHLFKGETLSFNVASDIFKRVFNSRFLSSEFLTFCKLLCKNNSIAAPASQSDTGSIATASFLDNDYSKKAIERFKTHLSISCEAEFDFNSVCEAVYSGRSNFAMIPLLNTRDGLIISLYRLLQKYDLRIIASTKILMNDGNTETEFVLVSRKLSYFPLTDDTRLMLSITHPYDNTITELLSATASQNITMRSVNTLPLEYTDERCESVIILDVSACPPDAIRCFLHSALPEASIVGIYSIVK